MKHLIRRLRHLRGVAVVLGLAALAGCATGPGESRIELDNVVRDMAGASPRWQPAEPAQAGLRVWRGMQEIAATRGMRLQPGDVVQTGPSSAAVIRYSGGAAGAGTGRVTLDEKTRVRVGSLEVFFGRIFANVRGLFETTSENIVAGVEGTRFLFEVAPNRDARVVVADGVVVCSSRSGSWQSLRLHANQALVSVYPGRAPPRVMPAAARELRDLEDWASQVASVVPQVSPAPYFEFGLGRGRDRRRGGGSDDGAGPGKTRDPAQRGPN